MQTQISHPTRERVSYLPAVMPPIRQPRHDSLAPSEPHWEEVELGPGQMPGVFGNGDFQWTPDADPIRGGDIRRTPGREQRIVLHRRPERPA